MELTDAMAARLDWLEEFEEHMNKVLDAYEADLIGPEEAKLRNASIAVELRFKLDRQRKA